MSMPWLRRTWRRSSLRFKILGPIIVLMLFGLAFSTLSFVLGITRTQEQLLRQQAQHDLSRIEQSLSGRTATVLTSANMLASDPTLRRALAQESEESLLTLNQRAVVLRDRMGLDLVQIYDRHGVARANLLMASVYRQSSLLDQVSEPGLHVISSGANLLLIARTDLDGGRGTVLTGIDLASEMERLTTLHRLDALLTLHAAQASVSTAPAETLTDEEGHLAGHRAEQTLSLGDEQLTLCLTEETAYLRSITTAGLRIMITAMLGTTVLLIVVGYLVAGHIANPVQRLAESARTMARGDWHALAQAIPSEPDPFLATEDEVTLLTRAFERMLLELQTLYRGLEIKVDERTCELLQAEERYRRFFEEDLAGVFVSNSNGQIQTCNPAFARIFGFASAAEAINHPLQALFPELEQYELLHEELLRSRRVTYQETQLVAQQGTPVHVIWNVIAELDEQGQLAAIKGYIFDNSDRVKLEEQLRQSQKMEAVGRLAGGVAHDFNNLLTVIIGYSELLLDSVSDTAVDDYAIAHRGMQDDLEMIRNAAQKAATLTRQLLAFSRKQIMQPKILDVNAIVLDMGKMLQRLIGENIVLDMRPSSDVPQVSVDPGQLEQVVLNLAVNAREAMPSGGHLIIETTRVNFGQAYVARNPEVTVGDYALLAVSDTGMGMDKETLGRIFEPFFTTKDTGTGLGLSTVYGIIKQSAGHISVYSEPGQGTTFRIYLPAASPEASTVRQEAPDTRHVGPLSVLLVEDEDMVRQLATRALKQQGYDVTCAVNGRQAVSMLEQQPAYDLIISDVIMPEMSGGELLEHVQAYYPDIKMLFMSGYTDTSVTLHGITTSELPFIQKPFSPDALVAKVGQVIADHHSVEADVTSHLVPVCALGPNSSPLPQESRT